MAAIGGNSISFAEIVKGRDSTVRVTVDGLIYAVDLVMVMTGKSNNESNECLRELNPSLFNKENFFVRSRSRLVSFQHAIELVMVLPGKVAKETRTQFASIIKRYMAGDASLVDEIKANAESDDAINQLARADMPQVQVQVEDGHTRKRKALELETLEADLHTKRVNTQARLMEMYATLCPGGQLDDRTRLHFKDTIVNLSSAAAGNYPAITNGEAKSLNAPLTISTVAAELGLQFSTSDLQSVGHKVKKLYVSKHGTAPPKHDQLCGGAVRPVCSYTERDRDIVERALRDYARMREDEY